MDNTQITRMPKRPGWSELSVCGLCGSTRFAPTPIHRDYLQVCRCEDCQILFLNPRPEAPKYNKGHVQRKYLPSARERKMITDSLSPNLPVIYQRYRKIADLTASLRPTGPVADVGCGIGFSMLALKHIGIESIGLEVDEEFIECAKDNFGLNVVHHDVLSEPLPELVDVATLSSVLEHIPDPIQFLRGVRRNVLSEHGALVVTVPNVFSLEYVRDGNDWNNINGGHLWYFSEKTLAMVAEKAGFTVEKTYRARPSVSGTLKRTEVYLESILGIEANLTGGIGMVLRASGRAGGAVSGTASDDTNSKRPQPRTEITYRPAQVVVGGRAYEASLQALSRLPPKLFLRAIAELSGLRPEPAEVIASLARRIRRGKLEKPEAAARLLRQHGVLASGILPLRDEIELLALGYRVRLPSALRRAMGRRRRVDRPGGSNESQQP